MLDFHSHILPFIDDGAKDVSMALEMLVQSKTQKVEKIVATPHFNYEGMKVKEFIGQRNKAAVMLKEEAEKNNIYIPQIILGAEVYLTPGISEKEDLELLCIEGTRCILIELPASGLGGWVYNELYKIRTRELVPILAHLERYALKIKNEDKLLKLLSMEVCVQVNADNILKLRYRKVLGKLFAISRVLLLGSDSHNTTSRKTKMAAAMRKVRCRFGPQKVSEIKAISEIIMSGNFEF